MAEGDQTLVQDVPIDSLKPKRSQAGRQYWKATDLSGIEWAVWDSQLALQYIQLYGQTAIWGVRVSPAKDPRFGMNYELRSLAAVDGSAHQGLTAAPAPQSLSVDAQLAQALGQLPTSPPATPPSLPQLPQASPQPPAAGVIPQSAAQTLGQGGNFSDADITRMARSTSLEAVSRLALVVPDEFKLEDGKLDWMKFYLAAESLAKFITHRTHQGWIPGVEINPAVPNEAEVVAEVNAQFPDAVVRGMPEPGEPGEASAENAAGGEVDWE